jgi:PilZ domain
MALQKREHALDGALVPRGQPRVVNQRCEERLEDVVKSATILFREQEYLVPVINISSRGTMIESDLTPRVGETILIQFENCTRIHGFVRWVREGHVGLSFGHEIILG